MAQSVANINASLNLDSASFQSGAAKARVAMQSAMAGIQQDVAKTANSLQSLTTGIKGAAAAFGIGFGIQQITQGVTNFATAVVKSGDTLDQLKAKLNLSVGEGAFTQVALSAQKLGVSVETVGATMSRLAYALKQVGTSQADLTTVTETLVQMGRVAGSTGAEIESALTQFSQGLSKGRLDGDELKSVLETMPPLARLLADELGVSVGQLRDLGAEGKITSEVAIQAILNGAVEINKEFNKLGENLDQATSRMQSQFQAMFAAIDDSWGASDFYKDWILGGLEAGAAKVAAIFTKQATTFNDSLGNQSAALKTQIEGINAEIAKAQKGLLAESPAVKSDIAAMQSQAAALQKNVDDIERQIDENVAKTARLSDPERLAHGRAAQLRPGFGSTVERSLFSPAVTPEDQRAVNLTTQAFERAAAERARIAASAAADRVGIESQTNADLAKLDEERLADFQTMLDAEIAAEREARGVRGQIAQSALQTQNSLRLQAERESMEALPAFEEEQAAAQQRSADKLAGIYAQPFKDLATNISRTLSSGIQDALSGDFDFSTFAEGFGDIFADTLAASITAALAPELTKAAANFGNVLTEAVTNAFSSGTPGAPGTPATKLSVGGAALGGAAFGGIAGGLYGQYGGLKPGNQAGLGGGIGGAGGAALGAWLMPANPLLGAGIGGSLGGLLGSFTGGLFGGQNNLGNDRSAQAYRSGRGITYSDASFSPENRNITQGILDQVVALQKALEDAGGAIADFGLRIEAGNKSGITVGGKTYRDAQAAMAASLEILIGSTTGLSVSQQTVLATTQAKDAQGIVADLGVAEQFDQLTFKGTELERALVALDAEMAAFGKRAQALGLDINAVAAAHEEERQALIDAQAAEQNAIRAAIEGLSPSGKTLDIVLAQLNDQVQELAKAATAAGLPLDQLAAAHQRAATQLVAANAQLQQSLALQVSALDPAADKLSVALGQLNQQVQDLAAQIIASGGSLDSLAGAHQRAAADLINQFHQQQQLERSQAEAERQRARDQAQAERERQVAEAQAFAQQTASFSAQVTLLEADPLHTIVINLQERIRSLIEEGRKLGLTAATERQIRAAGARLEAQAIADYNKTLAERLRSYQSQVFLLEANPLDAALRQIRDRFDELIEQGKEMGLLPANESQIRAAQGRAEAAARTRAKLDQDTFTLQLRGMGAASNDAGLQMAELLLQFRELTLRATELNVPLNLVTEAQARATQALQDQLALQKLEVRDQIAAAAGGTSSLADQLRELDVQMRQLARAAAGVGIPLSEVEAAHVKAAQRIRDEWAEMLADMQRRQRDATQGILEAQRSAAGAIDQFLNPFKAALGSGGIGQGVYAAATLTQSALKEFRETLAQARTGDTGALGSLVSIGQGAIAQARQTFGSTAAFAAIFKEIETGLREQRNVLEAKRDELLRQIGTFGRETVNEIIRLRVQAIGDLRADLAKLSRDLIVAVEGRT